MHATLCTNDNVACKKLPTTKPVYEVSVAIELVLDDVVEDLEKEEDQVVVGGRGEEEPRCGEGLQEMEQLAGGDHGHGLDVGRDVA